MILNDDEKRAAQLEKGRRHFVFVNGVLRFGLVATFGLIVMQMLFSDKPLSQNLFVITFYAIGMVWFGIYTANKRWDKISGSE